ncbi:transposable element Tcb1 transposase [Trichonephila clavipes]|nr:transposable element Tcb1 transposase [Trichonephila clavipes]
MDWPAYSPDLNPIEHVWDMLNRRIAARQPPPTCLPELRRALLDEWCNIPQDQIDNLILSMPRRYPSLINRGCGSPVGKVTHHDRHVMSSSPAPLKIRHVGEKCTLNLPRAQTSSCWCGVVIRRGGAAQVSSSSLDHGSKLRGPSPKALV